MPWTLLAVGTAFALATLNVYRPLYWPGWAALVSFFFGWIVGELALHVAAIEAFTAVALASDGGLDAWPGVAGLALTGVSVVGLVRAHAVARATPAAIDAALREHLGCDEDDEDCEQVSAWRLACIFPIRHRQVVREKNIVFHREGKRELCLDVYRRRDLPANAPTLLFVHGGGWVIGNKNQQGLLTVNAMAARGWTCVSTSYRLSPRATFPDHIHDVKRALRWIREHGREHGANPDFVVIAGGSAGAHLASLAALTPNAPEYQRDFPDVDTSVAGCVAYYGVYDFTDDDGHHRHRDFRRLLELVVMKRKLHRAREEFEKASPVHRIGDHAPPFLMLHGDRDSLAPITAARWFARRLRAVSPAPVVLAELSGAQHAFEIFPSVRSTHAVRGVARFCDHLWKRHQAVRSRQDSATL